MASIPAADSTMDRTATQSKPTLLTIPREIRTMIWKLSQISSGSPSLEMTDCTMIQQHGVCNDACDDDPTHWRHLLEFLPMPLCPLLLVNHQTRSETLPIEKPRRTIHFCLQGWRNIRFCQHGPRNGHYCPHGQHCLLGQHCLHDGRTRFLNALTVAQRSLVNRFHLTMTFNEHHTLDKDGQRQIAESWSGDLKEELLQYYEQVEIIGWTCTVEENVLPQDVCTVPDWQVIRMELGVENAIGTMPTCPALSGGEKEGTA